MLAETSLFSRRGQFEFSALRFRSGSQLPARSSQFSIANPVSQSFTISSGDHPSLWWASAATQDTTRKSSVFVLILWKIGKLSNCLMRNW